MAMLGRILILVVATVAFAAPSVSQEASSTPKVTVTAKPKAEPRTRRSPEDYPSASSASRRLQAYGDGSMKTTLISPTYGPMEGNSLVIVVHTASAGHDGTQNIECVFGTSKTTGTYINTTHVSCRTPKHSTGSKNFKLQVNSVDVGFNGAQSTFTYFPTMYVSDFKTSSVLRYNADTGAFFDVFVQPRSGGLDGPWGLAFGLDHNFYVSSERTNSVLVYDGSTGAFLKKFCTVKGQPRSIVFHYWDLYVVSAYGDKVYRYNGYTGSPRGVYLEGGGLDHPWGLMFDKYTNDTYVTSEYKDHVFRYKQPTWGLYGGYNSPSTNGGIHVTGQYNPTTQETNPQGMGISNGLGEEITHNAQQLKLGVNVWKGRFDKVWTNTRVNYANGLDFTVDSMYVTGPYSGKAIVRFNRTTGEYMHHFEDEYLNYPVDIKEFRDYIYVCSEDQVRKYNRLNGEFIKTHSQTDGLLGSFLLFHINWNQNLGE
jgi:hypothetical protein